MRNILVIAISQQMEIVYVVDEEIKKILNKAYVASSG